MALTTVSYSSYFNYALSTKQITFTDSTDYVGQGTVAANVTVVAKVESPLGVFYNNTSHDSPDIDPGVSLDSIITIPLPLDSGGLPVQGLYTITLTYVDSVVPATVIDVKTFTLNYTSPSVSITGTVDCVTPLLKFTDESSYTKNLINPTITRAFAIHYPPSTPTADVTGTASTISTRVFYTLADSTIEHSSSLTSTLSYLFSSDDLIYVIDSVTGSKVIQVACNGDICDIYCCIRAQWLKYFNAKSTNSPLAAIELEKFKKITALAGLVGIAVKCGKNEHISAYVAEILNIAQCDAGCGCSDGTPQLVTGLAINGNDIVVAVSDSGGLTVAVTEGGVTTYTLSLDSINTNKLAATYNSVVAAGTNISSVGVGTATAGDVTTKTYTVNAIDTIVQSLFVRAKLTFGSAVVPVITIDSQNEYGTTFQAINQAGSGTDFLTNNNVSSYAVWAANLTHFTIGNFFASATDYFPEVKVVNVTGTNEVSSPVFYDNDLAVEIVSIGASSFDIKFVDQSGSPVNGLFLQDFTSIELIFKLHA